MPNINTIYYKPYSNLTFLLTLTNLKKKVLPFTTDKNKKKRQGKTTDSNEMQWKNGKKLRRIMVSNMTDSATYC